MAAGFWRFSVCKNPHKIVLFYGVILCCYFLVGAESFKKFESKKAQNFSNNFVKRQDDESIVVAAVRKLFPERDARLTPVPANLLQVVLNASGVLGLGFLWIKEISYALGTPILGPILWPPLIVLAAAILLIPDLSRLGDLVNSAIL